MKKLDFDQMGKTEGGIRCDEVQFVIDEVRWHYSIEQGLLLQDLWDRGLIQCT